MTNKPVSAPTTHKAHNCAYLRGPGKRTHPVSASTPTTLDNCAYLRGPGKRVSAGPLYIRTRARPRTPVFALTCAYLPKGAA
jgi:hypothetical protein